MYILIIIIIIKRNLNQPILLTKSWILSVRLQAFGWKKKKHTHLFHFFLNSQLFVDKRYLWLHHAMIHLSMALKSWRAKEDQHSSVKCCLSALIFKNKLSFRCVWTWMTHKWRTPAGSSMWKCNNVICEVCDWNGRDEEKGAFRRENTVCPGASSGGLLLHLVIEKSSSVKKTTRRQPSHHFTPLVTLCFCDNRERHHLTRYKLMYVHTRLQACGSPGNKVSV